MGQKSGNKNFDVPIDCYDGAEVCEIFESFILNNIGLYRDGGLGIFQNISKPETQRKEKAIVKVL